MDLNRIQDYVAVLETEQRKFEEIKLRCGATYLDYKVDSAKERLQLTSELLKIAFRAELKVGELDEN